MPPGVRWPWELPSHSGAGGAVPRGRGGFGQLAAPLGCRHRARRLRGYQPEPTVTPLTCLGTSAHGNALAAGCQMLESYKWETFGEGKKQRSQLLTGLKCIWLYVFFVEGLRRRIMKIFEALLEKYRLFLLQR